MNQISLVGRITKDIKVNYTANQMAVTRFTLAVNRDKENTDFVPCIAFGKQAENLETYCKKGNQIAVSGRLQSGSYEGAQGKVYTLDVVANNIEFLTPKGTGENKTTESTPVPPKFEEIEEDIPF